MGGRRNGLAVQAEHGLHKACNACDQLEVADDSAPPGVVVLLSDGEPTIGRPIDTAIAEAVQAGIPVSTLALGTPDGEVTVEDPDAPGTFVTVPVPVDEESLRAIAENTGGNFFAIASAEELAAIYREIGSAVGFETVSDDMSVWFSGAALAFGEKARKVSLGPASKNKEAMQTAMNKVNTTMSALTQHAGATTARRGK